MGSKSFEVHSNTYHFSIVTTYLFLTLRINIEYMGIRSIEDGDLYAKPDVTKNHM